MIGFFLPFCLAIVIALWLTEVVHNVVSTDREIDNPHADKDIEHSYLICMGLLVYLEVIFKESMEVDKV